MSDQARQVGTAARVRSVVRDGQLWVSFWYRVVEGDTETMIEREMEMPADVARRVGEALIAASMQDWRLAGGVN